MHVAGVIVHTDCSAEHVEMLGAVRKEVDEAKNCGGRLQNLLKHQKCH